MPGTVAEAFGVLVHRCQDRLYPTILPPSPALQDAQDVLQDAFIRAGREARSVSRRKFLLHVDLPDCRQSRLERPSQAPEPSVLTAEPARQEPPRGRSGRADPRKATPRLPWNRSNAKRSSKRHWAKLGPEHRAVVILKDFDGRRYEEISALLNIPVGTVRSRLHRARAELRRSIAIH